MPEIVITSSLLILIIIALRFALRSWLSPTVIYALWAVVALRLLVPFSIADTHLSVMNLFRSSEPAQTIVTAPQPEEPHTGTNPPSADAVMPDFTPEISAPPNGADTVQAAPAKVPAGAFLKIIWLCGTAAIFVFSAVSNLQLFSKLKASRKALEGIQAPLPVYTAEDIGSPFLFGLLRPAIYMNDFAAEDKVRAGYVITHELTHYRHLDHIWAVVRVVCLAVHWFNPLVWLAAYLSRQDSELACDSAVIRAVGEEYSIDYGRTLVDMVNVRLSPTDMMLTSTTMSAGFREIKERLSMIKIKPRTFVWAAAAAMLVILAAFVVTFTGAAARQSGQMMTQGEDDILSLSELPSDIYCVVYDRDNPLYDVSASIRTVRELTMITNVLDSAVLNPAEPESIPSDSWIAASLNVDGGENWQITNDGFVIKRMSIPDDGRVSVFINTDNIARGSYYDGCYGFYRIPDDVFSGLIEQLHGLCEKYRIVTPGGVGEYNSMEISNLCVQLSENGGEAYQLDPVESAAYRRIIQALNSPCWQRVSADSVPGPENLVVRIIINDFADIFDICADGLVYVRFVRDDIFSDTRMNQTEKMQGEIFADWLNGYITEDYGVYRMADGTLETLMLAIDEAVAVYESEHSSPVPSEYPDLLAEYTTYYNPANTGRSGNLELAAEYINGTILQPGETFSFNNTVGERTPERGFSKADIYTFEENSEEYGGGISQTASTLYNAAVMSGMEITEHHTHLYTVNYVLDVYGEQKNGCDAAVSWGRNDLQFVNSKQDPVIIMMSCDNGTVTARIYGTDDGFRREMGFCEQKNLENYQIIYHRPKEGCVNQAGQYGMVVEVSYNTYENDQWVGNDFSYTASYMPLMEIVYTDVLPAGCRYDKVYDIDSIPRAYDPYGVWSKPEFQYLLEDVPVLEDGELTYYALHKEGIPISEWGEYNLQGTTPPIDWLVMVFRDLTQRQRLDYIQELHDAGFVHHAGDGSENEDEMCVFYNAPQNGVGVQLDALPGESMTVIFFPQGDGCYGYSEHVPKG